MSWATEHIAKLKAGETVSFRPLGNSMTPRIESGQLCTVEPIRGQDIAVDDVVLCRVHGSDYLHLVKAVRGQVVLIGNNKGGFNGWIAGHMIFGRLVSVAP